MKDVMIKKNKDGSYILVVDKMVYKLKDQKQVLKIIFELKL